MATINIDRLSITLIFGVTGNLSYKSSKQDIGSENKNEVTYQPIRTCEKNPFPCRDKGGKRTISSF